MLTWDVIFLEKSYREWANVNKPAIFHVTTELVNDDGEYDKNNIPDLIPHYKSNNNSDLDNNNHNFLHPFALMHDNYISDDEDSDDAEDEVMECPPVIMDIKEDDILALNYWINDPLKVARQNHKKAVEILCKIEFSGGDVDPCLFWKKYDKGIVFVAIDVDDNLIVSHPEAIDDTIKLLKTEQICA